MKERDDKDKLLENVDPARRHFLKRVLGAGFVAPVVATFAIEALTPDSAKADPANQTFEEWYVQNIPFY